MQNSNIPAGPQLSAIKSALPTHNFRSASAVWRAPCVQFGVQAGDRVAFLSANCHRLLEAYYGVPEAGAVLLPLNIRLASEELAYILNDSGSTVLFVEKQFLGLAESFRKNLRTVKTFVQLDGSPDASWLAPHNYDSYLSAARPHRADINSVDENALAELFYTSGTSANPKGVMLTHRNIYLHALNVCLGFQIENGAVELHTIPLFHANGWGVAHFLTLLGGKHVMIQRFETKEVFRLIEKEKVHSCSLVPIMATALVNCPERHNYDLSTLRRIVIGGAASSPTLIREVEEATRLRVLFGLRPHGDVALAYDFPHEVRSGLGRRTALYRPSDDRLRVPRHGDTSSGRR